MASNNISDASVPGRQATLFTIVLQIINSLDQYLDSGDSLVLQHPDNHTAIFSLPFGSLVVADLMGFTQRAWREHSGKGDVPFLDQDIGYVARAVFTEFLVQRRAAGGGSIAFHFDDVAVDGLGLLSQS